jgi:hypothetical protein
VNAWGEDARKRGASREDTMEPTIWRWSPVSILSDFKVREPGGALSLGRYRSVPLTARTTSRGLDCEGVTSEDDLSALCLG